MVKFCNFNGEIMRCDDATIEKYNLTVIKEFTDEEFSKYGNYYVKNNEVILGVNPVEITNNKILELTRNLSDTDYQAIKYAEGELSYDAYLPMKIQRRKWREEIRELEKKLNE